MITVIVPAVAGSPPHTRGKQALTRYEAFLNRLTPAHAGKTLLSDTIHRRNQAHPRTRGENYSGATTGIRSLGSPPHTRGKLVRIVGVTTLARLTPAHAGKTIPPTLIVGRTQAHPRTRGENVPGGIILEKTTGSPPHTRGKLLPQPIHRCLSGLTPAHAGKTF